MNIKDFLDYNHETGVFTWKESRGRVKAGSMAGTVSTIRGKKYIMIRVNGKQYGAHRLAFLWVDGKFPANEVDHVDGNGLNNSWRNLRSVTHQENGRNRRKPKNNTSGYTGVHWHKTSQKWGAYIHIEGKNRYLGYFANIEDAISARAAASAKNGFHENHGSNRPL